MVKRKTTYEPDKHPHKRGAVVMWRWVTGEVSRLHFVDTWSPKPLTMCGAFYKPAPGAGITPDTTRYGLSALKSGALPCPECFKLDRIKRRGDFQA